MFDTIRYLYYKNAIEILIKIEFGGNKMKNKILKNSHVIGIAISLLLIISIFSTIVLAERNELKNNGINTIIFNDELDQSQTNIDQWIYMESNTHLAQSFVPQLTNLTRVELLLTKDPGYPPSSPFELAIRDNLTGINLAHKSVNPEQIPIYPYSDWIEFDFDDISMTTGQSYYIIAYTNDDEGYMWGSAEDNPYLYGMMFYSTDGGYNWNGLPASFDACFKTYGYGGGGPDTTLEIEITGGFGAHVVIRNVGDYDAIDVEWSVNITGGILGRIDHHFGGTIGILPAGNETTIEISSLIVGLGPIEIAVTADASNAEPVIETKNGFIFLFFVILR